MSSLLFLKAPKEELAKCVLAEVPGQVVTFFNMMKYPPPNSNTPVDASNGVKN